MMSIMVKKAFNVLAAVTTLCGLLFVIVVCVIYTKNAPNKDICRYSVGDLVKIKNGPEVMVESVYVHNSGCDYRLDWFTTTGEFQEIQYPEIFIERKVESTNK